MKRPVVLIVGAAAGALLLAGIGASAHSGFAPAKLTGVQFGDEASGAQVEPTETPEPSQAAEPAETENDEDENDDNDDQGENTGANVQVGTGDHETGDKQTTGGGHDD